MNLLEQWMSRAASRLGPDTFFVQVGANDGFCLGPDGMTSACPLYPFVREHSWPGLLVEPVPYLFDRLRDSYREHSNLIFEKIAISDVSGPMPFFRISEAAQNLPWYASKIGGLTPKVILEELSFLPNLGELIVVETVPCETLNAVLERHKIQHVDLLQVDAEGADLRVLLSFDLQRYRPQVVMLEHKHLSPADRRFASRLLQDSGYALEMDETDLFATTGSPAVGRA